MGTFEDTSLLFKINSEVFGGLFFYFIHHGNDNNSVFSKCCSRRESQGQKHNCGYSLLHEWSPCYPWLVVERVPVLPTDTAPISASPFFYPSPWTESRRTRNIPRAQYAGTVHQSNRYREQSALSDTTMWHGHRCRIPCSTRIFSDQATRATGEKGCGRFDQDL